MRGLCLRLVGRLLPTAGAMCLAISIAGCASAPSGLSAPSFLAKDAGAEPVTKSASAEPKETPDPFENVNRKVFENNQKFNHAVLYPVAKAYREDVPEDVRDRIEAFSGNLSEPMVFANNLLQLRFEAAATTLSRFVTNSTVGLGGLFDVAATVGQKRQSGDFGQTLYVWGARDTAYLVLPVLGPTNVRDGIGAGLGLLAPAGVVAVVPAKLASAASQINTVDTFGKPVAGLGKVEMMEELEASSLDFYVMLRSMSEQKRQAELQEALAQSLLTKSTAAPAGEVVVTRGEPTPAAPAGLGVRPAPAR